MSDFRKQGYSSFVLLLLFFAYAFTSSCVATKKIVYFRDLPDTITTPVVMQKATVYEELKIESNDLLSINVQPLLQNVSLTPVAANSNASGAASTTNTYLVDKNGYIEYSLIGPVKVAGLTTIEAREVIKEKAARYYKDPVVSVRIMNFDFEILGDVTRPGFYNSPSEKVSIIDAISIAGDLNLTAKRDNILLIRTNGDQKIFSRYDMSSKNIFQSPNYYLKQRDIIYVEPNKFKVQSSDQSFIRNLGIMSSIISIASLVLVFKSIK
jgi:polysaccharide export outer membrane protein